MTLKRGILLINIGTPEAPTVPAVRRYLREFLSDPRVLTMPALLRWFLVNVVIVPFRAPKSTHAYQKIWTRAGSPLMVNSVACADKLRKALPSDDVMVAMRYGSPSIRDVVETLSLAGAKELIAVPMFPQFSEAATASAMAEFQKAIKEAGWEGPSRVVSDFYDQPEFISAQADVIRKAMTEFKPDYILMSYHGLPESHMKASDLSGEHCLRAPSCCDQIVDVNRYCYRAQSYATSRALAKVLGLTADKWSVSFQSRLGREPWIQPFTDVVLGELYNKGVRRLMVVCPSFVADCLETIEEIGIRARDDWKALGGEGFMHVPCVNDHDEFIQGLVRLTSQIAK